jgi:hypothetical protein
MPIWAIRTFLFHPTPEIVMMAANIVVVPDLAAVELTALVKRELGLFVEPDYERWDYYIDINSQPIPGRGLKFEALVWKPELKPDEMISSEAVRKYFRDLGAFGHTGAFTQWRRTCGLEGSHASIPEDEACWRNPPKVDLGAPCCVLSNTRRWFLPACVKSGWWASDSFVAFKPFND